MKSDNFLSIEKSVQGWIQKNDISKTTALIACSGGADSVALLHFIATIWKPVFRQTIVIHYNHRLRGMESDQDQSFVKNLAATYNLPFISQSADKENSFTNEEESRRARLLFYKEIAQTYGPDVFIFQGHHADDVIENMIMRLARGSGAEGLSSPSPISIFSDFTILRPLLNHSRDEIHSFIKANGYTWREDQSNHGDTYLRNRIRKNVIPTWEKSIDPDRNFRQGVLYSRKQLEEDADFISLLASEQLATISLNEGKTSSLNLNHNSEKIHPALLRRILQKWAIQKRFHSLFHSTHISQILESYSEGKKLTLDLSSDCTLHLSSNGFLQLKREEMGTLEYINWESTQLVAGNSLAIGSLIWIETSKIQLDENLRTEILNGNFCEDSEAWFDFEKLFPKNATPILSLAKRKGGEKYRPLGLDKEKKLKDCLIDRKVPKELRDLFPIFSTLSRQIIWMPGLLPSEDHKITDKTHCALRLTIRVNSGYWNILSPQKL